LFKNWQKKGTKVERKNIKIEGIPICDIIHIYRKCHNETPYIAILNKQKCHFIFHFQKCKVGSQNRSCLGGWYQWEEDDIRKGCRRVNMVKTFCTYICKWKNETCWNYSRNGEHGGYKKMMEGINSTITYYKNLCKCHNGYSVQQ
jgi:hypothetical protein